MFTCSRDEALAALDVMIPACCCCYGGGDRCDCKYGVKAGKWPTVHEDGNGCPELRSIRNLLATLTDHEWSVLMLRAGGRPSGMALFDEKNLASRLHSADAAAAMAQDNIARVREAISQGGFS